MLACRLLLKWPMTKSEFTSAEQTSGRPGVAPVIDDEIGPRESLRISLASKHEVLTADGARPALEILRSRPHAWIDLVTVDRNMPGMRGDEVDNSFDRDTTGETI